MKTLITIVASGLLLFAMTFYWGAKPIYSDWRIINQSKNLDSITWVKFMWVKENFDGQEYEKAYMFIPSKIEGVPNVVTFQFDLGADLTGVYENNYKSLYVNYPYLRENIMKVKLS